MEKIKVNLLLGHSLGRGVGFYANNLARALEETGEVLITDKDPDLVHYPFFDLFYPTLSLFKAKPVVVTIHDLTPLVLKNLYPQGIRAKINLLRQRLSLTNVAAVITDSENSKKDLIKIFHLSKSKIFVTPLAIDEKFKEVPTPKFIKSVKNKYNLPDQFILTVAGGPNPNKNLPALAFAANKLNVPLVIVGKELLQNVSLPVHPELKDLFKLKNFKDLILPGFVPTNELNAIYRLATLYCQPSLYEGFGLPLLEAMTAGCLIISSNTSSLPKIYPNDAITFNPNEIDSIKEAISKAAKLKAADLQKLISSQNKKVEEFSWQKTASLTLAVYKQVISKSIIA